MVRLLLSFFLLVLFLPSQLSAKVPEYSVDEGGVHIKGIDGSNSIIYDNDWWNDVFDSYYVWAQVQCGAADLKGNIVSRDMWEHPNYLYSMQKCIDDCEKALQTARSAGWKNIPDPTQGADQALQKPKSDKIEDTQFVSSPGSRLIIQEAKAATKEKPLVVVSGGPLTTVAIALLENPSIAENMVVFNILTADYGYNGKDGWSAYIVAKNAYYVEWGDGKFWEKNSVFQPEHFETLPDNPVSKFIQTFIRTNLGAANQMGDGAPLVWMFDNHCWKNAVVKGAVFNPPAVRYLKNENKDVLVIPRDETDLKKTRKEFLRVLSDPNLGNR